jgi:hypothetical protein
MTEAYDVVEKLNTELYQRSSNNDAQCVFRYISSGYEQLIEFYGITVWSSECDEREWLELYDDYETIETFVRRQVKLIGKTLSVITEYIGGV